MSEQRPAVWEGDSWKHAKPLPPALLTVEELSRPEMQAKIDDEYRTGKMALDDWRALTDWLSEPPLIAKKP
jgi:hypothetical protein